SAAETIRERRPDLRLRLLPSVDPATGESSPSELPAGTEWADPNDPEKLAGAYASASACLLPAINEALGVALVESLAAGTPVIAPRSGGPPELVTDDTIGRLYEPDDEEDLLRAIEETL